MLSTSKLFYNRTGATTDPYFPYVSLLLETTSTNGQNNQGTTTTNGFLDSSTNNLTITRNGTPTQGSVTPYWPNGQWSNYFNGSSDYLTLTNSAALNPGTGAFTFECWAYATTSTIASGGASPSFLECKSSGLSVGINSSGQLAIGQSFVSFLINDSATFTAFQWVHVVAVRSGTNLSLYKNGVRVATSASNSTNFVSSSLNYIGNSGNSGGANNWPGYISNMRLVIGTAVYDPTQTTITVPTAPLTAITNTALLTCQSNRFKDSSTNNFTITVVSAPKTQAFQPFPPAASYTTAAYGGSGYFSVANTDYLLPASSSALAFGNNAYTVEFWIYMAVYTGGNNRVVELGSVPGSFGAQINNTGTVSISKYGSVDVLTSSASFVLGQWNHVAFVRTSTGASGTAIYINGKNSATGTDANNWTGVTTPRINGLDTFSLGWVGYLSNLRIVNGTAVYSGDFTPPTTPLTAITNTSLLLNFTNAGIYDAAVQNNAITVGDAQASTTVSKWSPTSMKFDGTGDWLTSIDGPQLQLGTGDFTIDGWFYLAANGVAYGIVSKGTASTGWSVNVTSGNRLQFSYTASNLTGATTTLAATTWYYFAVVRSGSATGNLKIYINGSVEATSGGAVTDNFNQTDILYVGASRTGTTSLNGYLQDVRITKGFARTITTPTSAFPTR